MQARRVARRYAQALGLLADERGKLDRIEADLLLVKGALEESAEFRRALYDGRVLPARRRELLGSVFQGKLADETLHFLYLLVAKHRIQYLEAMIEAYIEYANERRGIIEVKVTSAKELDEHISQSLAEGFSKALDAKVRLRTSLDPALLGGVTVRVGDLLIDGSALSRLTRLGRSLRAAQLN